MKDSSFDAFLYHSDVKLPERLKKLLDEAKKEGKGYAFTVLIVKDKSGNQYELTLRKDQDAALQRYLKKFTSLDLLVRSFLEK